MRLSRLLEFALVSVLGLLTLVGPSRAAGPAYWGTVPQGMGGAYTAAVGGVSGISYNPASSASITDYEFASDFTQFSQNSVNVNRGSVGFGFGLGSVSQAIAYNRTALDFEFDNFSVTTPGLSLNYDDNILYYNASIEPIPSIRLGANAKYFMVRSDVENAEATGYGADIGYQQLITRRVVFGLSVLNLTANRQWDSGLTEDIPRQIRAGLRVRPARGLALEVDGVNDENAGFHSVALGGEWWLVRELQRADERVGIAFRGGVEMLQTGDEPTNVSLGLSFKTSFGELHYAFEEQSNFDNQQKFGLTLMFGGSRY